MDQEAGQANKASNKTSERQAQANRLVSSYRQEANVLLKEVLRAQNRWRNELQQELGVLAGVPNMKPYVRAQPHVRRRIEWKQSERDALKKHLLGLGLGRWKEIHAVLEKSLRGFRHGPGDVEDACWQLLGEVQLLLTAPDDRLYVARLMDPIADRGPVWTPGAGYTKLQGSAKSIIRRLALLEEFNALMPALLRSEAVAGYFRSLAHTTLPAAAAAAPAPWWDVECDVALMAGMYRHGYANFEAIRKDTYFEQAFQGSHPLQDPKARVKPAASRAETPAEAGTTPNTPAPDTAEAADKQQAVSPAAGRAGVTAAADVQAPATSGIAEYINAWPSAEVLSKRARKLIDLLGQAVAIAEELGLLQPLPDSELTGQAAADAALKGQFKEPGTYKARAAQPSSVTAVDGSGITTAEAAAAAGAAPWSQPGSPDLQDLPADLGLLDGGGMDDLLLGEDLDEVHDEPVGGGQEDEEEEPQWEEEQYEDDEAAGADSDAWQQQQGNKGRGGRVRKPSVVAAEAAETEDVAAAAVSGADGGATGRRRVHRPSKRLAEHVVYDVPEAGDGGTTWTGKGEGGGGHVTKKVRKDMLDLVMVWGLPPIVAQEVTAAAAGGGDRDYDWEAWYGSSCFTPALKKLGTQELTLVLKELLCELEDFNNAASAAAAAGTSKPKNQHNPNCECVVCTNRRRFEERKQQEAAAAAVAAAAAAGASEEEQQAAAAAAVAALQSKDEAAEAQEEKHKPKVQMPQGEVLTALTASRLQERLETLDAFNAATQMLGNPALDAAFKRGSKDLPGWWAAEHDEALILGVLQYGFGSWGPMFEDPNMPFKSAAITAIAAGLEEDTTGSKAKGKGGSKATSDLPSWVPDPKVLGKRCKTLVGVIKKILAKPLPAQKHVGKGGHGGKGGGDKGGTGKGAQAAPAGGLAVAQNPAAAALQMRQVQQLAAIGMLRPSMVQQIAPGAAGAGLTQQQQQQLYLAQQQQQQASVLGKRTAGMAGLPSGPDAAATAAAALAPSATRSAATTPTLCDGAAPAGATRTGAAAASGGGGAAIPASPPAAVIVTAGPTIAAAVAQAASPPLTASQVQALEQLPRLVRDARSRPVLPLMLSKELTLLALGRIEPSRPEFHTSSHIFPIGYSCSVKSLSSVAPGGYVTYTCAITDGGASGPLFVVMARDTPGQQWMAATATAVWQQVQERVQQVQQQAVPAVDGFEMFGLRHPLISMLIQELPGADQCTRFSAAQSAAPPHVATAIKQCQHIMAQRMQHLPASAIAAATSSAGAAAQDAQPLQQQQAQALQAQLLQQQLARMQGGQAPSQQQQAGGALQSAALQISQQQQMMQLLQQRQALQHQQVLLQQQLALKQQQQVEDANKRRRTSGTSEGGTNGAPTGQQAAHLAAAAAARGGVPGQMMPGMAQQLLMLQQQQQRVATAGGAQATQVALLQQQQQQGQQQQYLQQLSQQQQQVLLQQLAAGRLQQQQQPR